MLRREAGRRFPPRIQNVFAAGLLRPGVREEGLSSFIGSASPRNAKRSSTSLGVASISILSRDPLSRKPPNTLGKQLVVEKNDG